MKTKVILLIVLTILLGSCVSKKNPLAKAEWILGTWEYKDDKGNMIYHVWTKVNEKEFSGKMFEIKDADTIVNGYYYFRQEQDSLFHIVTIEEEENHLFMRFALFSISKDEMVFENLEQNFPERIIYRKIGNNSLYYEISGIDEEEILTLSGSFKKID